jgi:signal transduction histidine kinase/CheY-like chemotaxis protein/HAMP domain-containing protein
MNNLTSFPESGDTNILDLKAMLEVLLAVKKGDFSVRMPYDRTGIAGKISDTLNDIIEADRVFSDKLSKALKTTDAEGKTTYRIEKNGTVDKWASCIDSVNTLISDLVRPIDEIERVIGAVAKGDLSQTIDTEIEGKKLSGKLLRIADTLNKTVRQLYVFTSEVKKVANQISYEGKLDSKAAVESIDGVWREVGDSINTMVDTRARQTRDIKEIMMAISEGDFTHKITVEAKGEILEVKNTINAMVDQLSSFISEVTRLAREVGTDGKLGGQAKVENVSGAWKGLINGVNLMVANLTEQMRDISKVATGVARGDLSSKITVNVKGEILELKNAINEMVDQLGTVSSEVTRVAREVGTDGKLGGQAKVENVGGTWRNLIDSVNLMISNLTEQMRDISKVATGVAKGDLSTMITVDVKGETLDLKKAINAMVDRLGAVSSEVTRLAREVGTDGRLGGQAKVENVSGTWRDLTDSVNLMVNNLTEQMRDISKVATGVANGDLSTKITVDVKGEILELKNAINAMVNQLGTVSTEVTRIAREVGTDGRLGGQARIEGISGMWRNLTDSVNLMVSNLTEQMRDISKVATAVANGDLSTKIIVNVRGEILQLKNTINTMVDQLNSFSSEVTRVAREVGTEGKLGAQAHVNDVGGTWRDLTNNVNTMASNLTRQVRDIAKVVTAISKGNLKKRMTVDAEGELAELTETIDNMIDTLAAFAEQVTTVASEVGVEGKLGGQASVPGALGIWKNLTDNVNQLAENLTTQVRAINSVATAVAKGDLSHSVTVEAMGEVAVLKDNVNEMIANLKETTRKNKEQDWLNTNLAKFSRMLQGQRDLPHVCKLILSELAPLIKIQHGVFYICEMKGEEQVLKLYASYGFKERKHMANEFRSGESLVGQCLLEKQRILLTNVPADYVKINSALGEATPINIVILPIIFEGNVLSVLELASFTFFNDMYLSFLDQLAESVGIVINTVHTNMRTEELLKQSQSLTEELQQQQEELTQTNEELEEKANLLVDQKAEVERKNEEVEQSKRILEEKAEQLSITSRYKSEFLANMSHELRTPLNSLLVLAQQLRENSEGNLTNKQVEFAGIIYDSGNELLSLINDILDLSKIESGTVTPNYDDVLLSELGEKMERTFRHVAQNKQLDFSVQITPETPKSVNTDKKRVLQVLKNLLSNAFKFTSEGFVTLKIGSSTGGWSFGHPALDSAKSVLSFEVTDTGIGIPEDKQKIIFEAFQQADGSTNRKYGGTGLGLAISREIARILGGEIRLHSTVGQGSTFTLFLPVIPDLYEKDNGRLEISPVTSVNIVSEQKQNYKEHAGAFEDDRNNIQIGDKTLLIIEDDARFVGILSDMARSKDFKVIVTLRGGDAVDLTRKYMPSAIILDLRLPDVDGWTILERIRSDITIRHIPVHIITAEDERIRGLQKGALTFLNKPVSNNDLEKTFDSIKANLNHTIQNLLIVSGNQKQWDAKKVLDSINVKVISRSSGSDAISLLKKQPVDCIILDSSLSDMSVTQFVTKLQEDPSIAEIPVIVYTKRDIEKEEERKLNELAERAVLKAVKSSERLLDEVTLFLHKVVNNLPESKKDIIRNIYQSDDVLKDKKVLIVDDDMRNIFAMTSVLERHNVNVLSAENGKDALATLKNDPGIQIVLMDIMMPEMDGYETMRAIRALTEFKSLPIIALTAKAMKGDREKCIEAGASDYITKPIDTDQLLSLLRVWLYK